MIHVFLLYYKPHSVIIRACCGPQGIIWMPGTETVLQNARLCALSPVFALWLLVFPADKNFRLHCKVALKQNYCALGTAWTHLSLMIAAKLFCVITRNGVRYTIVHKMVSTNYLVQSINTADDLSNRMMFRWHFISTWWQNRAHNSKGIRWLISNKGSYK